MSSGVDTSALHKATIELGDSIRDLHIAVNRTWTVFAPPPEDVATDATVRAIPRAFDPDTDNLSAIPEWSTPYASIPRTSHWSSIAWEDPMTAHTVRVAVLKTVFAVGNLSAMDAFSHERRLSQWIIETTTALKMIATVEIATRTGTVVDEKHQTLADDASALTGARHGVRFYESASEEFREKLTRADEDVVEPAMPMKRDDPEAEGDFTLSADWDPRLGPAWALARGLKEIRRRLKFIQSKGVQILNLRAFHEAGITTANAKDTLIGHLIAIPAFGSKGDDDVTGAIRNQIIECQTNVRRNPDNFPFVHAEIERCLRYIIDRLRTLKEVQHTESILKRSYVTRFVSIASVLEVALRHDTRFARPPRTFDVSAVVHDSAKPLSIEGIFNYIRWIPKLNGNKKIEENSVYERILTKMATTMRVGHAWISRFNAICAQQEAIRDVFRKHGEGDIFDTYFEQASVSVRQLMIHPKDGYVEAVRIHADVDLLADDDKMQTFVSKYKRYAWSAVMNVVEVVDGVTKIRVALKFFLDDPRTGAIGEKMWICFWLRYSTRESTLGRLSSWWWESFGPHIKEFASRCVDDGRAWRIHRSDLDPRAEGSDVMTDLTSHVVPVDILKDAKGSIDGDSRDIRDNFLFPDAASIHLREKIDILVDIDSHSFRPALAFSPHHSFQPMCNHMMLATIVSNAERVTPDEIEHLVRAFSEIDGSKKIVCVSAPKESVRFNSLNSVKEWTPEVTESVVNNLVGMFGKNDVLNEAIERIIEVNSSRENPELSRRDLRPLFTSLSKTFRPRESADRYSGDDTPDRQKKIISGFQIDDSMREYLTVAPAVHCDYRSTYHHPIDSKRTGFSGVDPSRGFLLSSRFLSDTNQERLANLAVHRMHDAVASSYRTKFAIPLARGRSLVWQAHIDGGITTSARVEPVLCTVSVPSFVCSVTSALVLPIEHPQYTRVEARAKIVDMLHETFEDAQLMEVLNRNPTEGDEPVRNAVAARILDAKERITETLATETFVKEGAATIKDTAVSLRGLLVTATDRINRFFNDLGQYDSVSLKSIDVSDPRIKIAIDLLKGENEVHRRMYAGIEGDPSLESLRRRIAISPSASHEIVQALNTEDAQAIIASFTSSVNTLYQAVAFGGFPHGDDAVFLQKKIANKNYFRAVETEAFTTAVTDIKSRNENAKFTAQMIANTIVAGEEGIAKIEEVSRAILALPRHATDRLCSESHPLFASAIKIHVPPEDQERVRYHAGVCFAALLFSFDIKHSKIPSLVVQFALQLNATLLLIYASAPPARSAPAFEQIKSNKSDAGTSLLTQTRIKRAFQEWHDDRPKLDDTVRTQQIETNPALMIAPMEHDITHTFAPEKIRPLRCAHAQRDGTSPSTRRIMPHTLLYAKDFGRAVGDAWDEIAATAGFENEVHRTIRPEYLKRGNRLLALGPHAESATSEIESITIDAGDRFVYVATKTEYEQ